jgi:hypothetical protein
MSEIFEGLLPPSSFVKFKSPRLKFPKYAWKNPACAAHLNLREYAFALPHEGDSPERFEKITATFWSDRYGGKGVGYNGGSARCGADGNVQIKGIGQTPLIGTSSDKAHSHGGVTLNEAIREAIWGEIYAALTPFGAVRVLGIIGTNTYTYSVDTKYTQNKRALILRNTAIRPAHFMRAPYFLNSDPMLCGPGVDTFRAKKAINMFSSALANIIDPSEHGTDSVEFINKGLREVFKRLATQVAVTQAKRIPHGSLNCSNICLNGQLIDFATATSLPAFRPYFVTRGSSSFLSDEDSFKDTIKNLCFYLKKYLTIPDLSKLITQEELTEDYFNNYDTSAINEICKLTGFPVSCLRLCSGQLIEKFGVAFSRFLNTQGRSAQNLDWQICDDDLTRLIPKMACSLSLQEADHTLRTYIPDARIRSELIASYFELRNCCISHINYIPRKNVLVYAALNSIRLNSPIHSVFRPKLKVDIESLILNTNSSNRYASFIEKAVMSCICQLSDATNDEFSLDFICGFPSRMNLAGPTLLDGRTITDDDLRSILKRFFIERKEDDMWQRYEKNFTEHSFT